MVRDTFGALMAEILKRIRCILQLNYARQPRTYLTVAHTYHEAKQL